MMMLPTLMSERKEGNMQEIEEFLKGLTRGINNTIRLAYERGVKDGEEHREAKAIKNMAEYSQSRFQDGFQDGHELGANEVWEAVKRFVIAPKDGGLTSEQIEEIFGEYQSLLDIFYNFSVQEVLEKLKAWDERDIITVGDEVTEDEELTYIITRIYQGCYDAICPDGAVYHDLDIADKHKTGRHFDIKEILGKLGDKE